MRWCQSFIAEVSLALQQLGLTACPVCGSADALGIGHFPTLFAEGGPPPDGEDPPLGQDRDYDLTFAVRIECTACGHLMLLTPSSTAPKTSRSWYETEPRKKASVESDCLLGTRPKSIVSGIHLPRLPARRHPSINQPRPSTAAKMQTGPAIKP
jgi:hypothetical protein